MLPRSCSSFLTSYFVLPLLAIFDKLTRNPQISWPGKDSGHVSADSWFGWLALLLSIVLCTDARGADPAHPLQLRTVIIPRKVSTTKDRALEAVQRTETFILWDANKPIKPCGVGFVYLVEKIDGDRLLLSEPSEGLRGWVQRQRRRAAHRGRAVLLGADQSQPPQYVRPPHARSCPLRDG